MDYFRLADTFRILCIEKPFCSALYYAEYSVNSETVSYVVL